jgi:hypothetical protein
MSNSQDLWMKIF